MVRAVVPVAFHSLFFRAHGIRASPGSVITSCGFSPPLKVFKDRLNLILSFSYFFLAPFYVPPWFPPEQQKCVTLRCNPPPGSPPFPPSFNPPCRLPLTSFDFAMHPARGYDGRLVVLLFPLLVVRTPRCTGIPLSFLELALPVWLCSFHLSRDTSASCVANPFLTIYFPTS